MLKAEAYGFSPLVTRVFTLVKATRIGSALPFPFALTLLLDHSTRRLFLPYIWQNLKLRTQLPEYPTPAALLPMGLIIGSLLMMAVGSFLPDNKLLLPDIRPSFGLMLRPALPQSSTVLTGTSITVLGEMYGLPNTVRHEGSTEIWQYRTDTCVADFYLRAPESTDGGTESLNKASGAEVIYAELRTRQAQGSGASALMLNEDDAATCLSSLQKIND